MYLLLLSASSSLLLISTSYIALETSLPAQGGPILVVGGVHEPKELKTDPTKIKQFSYYYSTAPSNVKLFLGLINPYCYSYISFRIILLPRTVNKAWNSTAQHATSHPYYTHYNASFHPSQFHVTVKNSRSISRQNISFPIVIVVALTKYYYIIKRHNSKNVQKTILSS